MARLDEPARRALLRDVQRLLPPHERAFSVVYDEAKGIVLASATDGNVYYRRYPNGDGWRLLGADASSEVCVPYHVRRARQRGRENGGSNTSSGTGTGTDADGNTDGAGGSDGGNAPAEADAWEEAEARFAEFYIAHAHERAWPICDEGRQGGKGCINNAVVKIYNCGRYHVLCATHAREFAARHPTAQLCLQFPS